MPFYRLEATDAGENIMTRQISHPDVYYSSGKPIDEQAIELPFTHAMFISKNSGYDQYAPGFEGDWIEPPIEDRLFDYYKGTSLMTPKLVTALQSAGVDNLQVFPTKLTRGETDERLPYEYLFVNIVGLVACANMEKSQSDELGNTHYFHDLVIDEDKTEGLSIFRLAESRLAVIVNETVAKVINEGGFKGIEAVMLGQEDDDDNEYEI